MVVLDLELVVLGGPIQGPALGLCFGAPCGALFWCSSWDFTLVLRVGLCFGAPGGRPIFGAPHGDLGTDLTGYFYDFGIVQVIGFDDQYIGCRGQVAYVEGYYLPCEADLLF
jgi:hypothetical protein